MLFRPVTCSGHVETVSTESYMISVGKLPLLATWTEISVDCLDKSDEALAAFMLNRVTSKT